MPGSQDREKTDKIRFLPPAVSQMLFPFLTPPLSDIRRQNNHKQKLY